MPWTAPHELSRPESFRPSVLRRVKATDPICWVDVINNAAGPEIFTVRVGKQCGGRRRPPRAATCIPPGGASTSVRGLSPIASGVGQPGHRRRHASEEAQGRFCKEGYRGVGRPSGACLLAREMRRPNHGKEKKRESVTHNELTT